MNTSTNVKSFRHYRIGDTMDLAAKSRRFTDSEQAESVAAARGQNVYEYDQHGCVGEVPSERNQNRKLNP